MRSRLARRRREKNRGFVGCSKGKTRRRRENFGILGPLNSDFTRENGQNRGPKSVKIRNLADPPLVFRDLTQKGGGQPWVYVLIAFAA